MLAEDRLVISPRAGSPRAISLAEIAALEGADYELRFRVGDEWFGLSRLGGAGPTLHADLRRIWPPLRAAALRISGRGEPRRFRGRHDGRPAEVLVWPEVLVTAADGAGIEPLFLADICRCEERDGGYALECARWDEGNLTITHLGGETEAFMRELAERRAALAGQASGLLAASLSSLDGAARARLAYAWLPGRFVALAELESLAPGVGVALADRLASGPRARESAYLLEQWREGMHAAYVAPGFLSLTAEDGEEAPAGSSSEIEAEAAGSPASEAEDAAAEADDSGVPGPEAMGASFWLLSNRAGRWLLEAASERDFATYELAGEAEVPRLASHLLWAPHFSRQALYMPLSDLAGPRAALALPARELGFLRDLRARFRGRIIHSGFDAWRSRAAKGAG
jgi:hypothetical protein